jgi:hypothetical protein
MAFIRVDGSTRKNLPNTIQKTASVAFDPGDVVISTAGRVDVAVGSSVTLLGLAVQKVTSADSDYASTTPVIVEQIDPLATYVADVSTGSATYANVGTYYDLEDENSITLSGTTYKQVKVVGVISATKVLVTFNPEVL